VPDALPEEGDVTLGLVSLPPGRRVRAGAWEELGTDAGEDVMWITDEPQSDAGALWWFLQDQTELVVLVLDSLGAEASVGRRRPWDTELVRYEGEVPGADAVEGIFRFLWQDTEDADHPSVSPAPFTAFPGLAPSQNRTLSESVLAETALNQPPGWIGLAPAASAADSPMRAGWYSCSDAFAFPWGQWEAAGAMTALLRSWEQRFGARVMRLGWASMLLLVEKPPTSEDEALAVAAELWNVSSEFHIAGGGPMVRSVQQIAAGILKAPTWRFWWD